MHYHRNKTFWISVYLHMYYFTGTLSEIQTYLAGFLQSKSDLMVFGVKKDPTMQVFSHCYSKVEGNIRCMPRYMYMLTICIISELLLDEFLITSYAFSWSLPMSSNFKITLCTTHPMLKSPDGEVTQRQSHPILCFGIRGHDGQYKASQVISFWEIC